MKQALPIIIFALLYGLPDIHGQFTGSMGLKAGISLANQRYRFTPISYTLETDLVTSPGISVFVEAFRHGHLSFQSDVAYSVKGSKTTTQSVTVNHLDNDRIIVNKGDLQVSRFHYMSLCPMARYRIDKERITPYALLGPRLDFLLKYKADTDYPLEEQNRIILGLSGGMGVEYSLTKMGVFLEAQYHPDLSPVTSRAPLHINNNILLLTLGIRYLNID